MLSTVFQDLTCASMPGTSFPTNNDNFSNGFPMISTQAERMLQAQNRRKFSFPATLHSAALLEVGQREMTRRRLSNVSDVVTRKLSYTIGWKAAQIPAQDIITQVTKSKKYTYMHSCLASSSRDAACVDTILSGVCDVPDSLTRSWDCSAFAAYWATATPP